MLSVLLVLALVDPWPAEPWDQAANLTPIEGPAPNGFYEDLSGAMWNPVTRRLWLVRNGPNAATSKIWAVRETAAPPGWAIDVQDGRRGEWTGFGDLEAITFADFNSPTAYLMIEGEELIKAFDLSTYGVAVPVRTWNTAPHLPRQGGDGSEGITFVPDAYLRAGGFTDGNGQPYVSRHGMGGLMLVGHQNGGRVYAFDLAPNSSEFTFVGAYLTSFSETAELFFDRSTGLLFIFHGAGFNTIEVTSLASFQQGAERRLEVRTIYDRPSGSPTNANLEGMAIQPNDECENGRRWLFLTQDDGAAVSLLWFRQFPCVCRADVNNDGQADFFDYLDFAAAYSAEDPAADFNFDGNIDFFDYLDFAQAYAGGC